MKNWTIDDLDDQILLIFQKSIRIAADSCIFFEKSYIPPLKKGERLELFLFTLFYSWKYLQENNLISMTVDNAKMFIVAGLMKAEELNISIEVGEFNDRYKDRYIQHNKEFKEFIISNQNKSIHFPYYFYSQIDKLAIQGEQ